MPTRDLSQIHEAINHGSRHDMTDLYHGNQYDILTLPHNASEATIHGERVHALSMEVMISAASQ